MYYVLAKIIVDALKILHMTVVIVTTKTIKYYSKFGCENWVGHK
jgi:hypothetical protein